MTRVIDPVCGMEIDSDTAAARSKDAQGRTVYFCSVDCQREFEAHPERYDERVIASPGAAREATRPRDVTGDEPLERHEPPFTKKGPVVSPKFGSAGSGGAEYERLPERHDDDDLPESRR